MQLNGAAHAAIREAEQLISTVRAEGGLGGHALGSRTAISITIAADDQSPVRVDVCVHAFGHVPVPWRRYVVTLKDQKGDTLHVPLDSHGHGSLAGNDLAGVTALQGIDLRERVGMADGGKEAGVVDISQKRPPGRRVELEFKAEALALAAGGPVELPQVMKPEELSVELSLVPERTLRITIQALDVSLRNGVIIVDIRSRQTGIVGYSAPVSLEYGEGLRGIWDIHGEALDFPIDNDLIVEVRPKTD